MSSGPCMIKVCSSASQELFSTCILRVIGAQLGMVIRSLRIAHYMRSGESFIHYLTKKPAAPSPFPLTRTSAWGGLGD